MFFMTMNDEAPEKEVAPVIVEEKSPPIETPTPIKQEEKAEPKNYYGEGEYKIGVDIPASEYLMVGEGYFSLRKDSTGENGTIIENGNVNDTQRYIEVRDGEYLTISGNLKLYHEKDAPKIDTSEKVPDGQYKVGVDISEGEYKVVCFENAYIAVEKNSRGSIVTNRVPSGGSVYITVFNGQYLRLKNAGAYLVGNVSR